MRKPSPRTLSNRVSLYRAVVTQDEDGGRVVSYGVPFATDVPCSVPAAEPDRFLDPTTGPHREAMYDVIFRDDHSLDVDDKVVWVDGSSVSHNLHVHGSADQAGKGAASRERRGADVTTTYADLPSAMLAGSAPADPGLGVRRGTPPRHPRRSSGRASPRRASAAVGRLRGARRAASAT